MRETRALPISCYSQLKINYSGMHKQVGGFIVLSAIAELFYSLSVSGSNDNARWGVVLREPVVSGQRTVYHLNWTSYHRG